MDSAIILLEKMSEDLGLAFEPQDWGIVNSDGARILEFIAYFEKHPNLAPTQKFDLGGLILASANDLLVEEPSADMTPVLYFVEKYRGWFDAHVEYWQSLEGRTENPLGKELCGI